MTKTTSRKSNAYLVTTFFSNFQVLDTASPKNETESSEVANKIGDGNWEFLATASASNKGYSGASLHCLLSLEKVIKVSICAHCKSCERPVVNGVCSFVGCHAGELNELFIVYGKIVINRISVLF